MWRYSIFCIKEWSVADGIKVLMCVCVCVFQSAQRHGAVRCCITEAVFSDAVCLDGRT